MRIYICTYQKERKMNKRQKKKRRKAWDWTTAAERKRNKELCHRYPFLIPRSAWTDKITWDEKWDGHKQKAYSHTLVSEFSKGWWKAFGLMLCEDLRQELLKWNYLNEFRFVQIKEKFGEIRCYFNSIPLGCKVGEIINDYSHLSENICYFCSKPDVPMTNTGWYLPICWDCFLKGEIKKNKYRKQPMSLEEIQNYYEECKCGDGIMSDSRKVIRYHNGGSEEITYDLRDKAEKIRARWRCRNGM